MRTLPMRTALAAAPFSLVLLSGVSTGALAQSGDTLVTIDGIEQRVYYYTPPTSACPTLKGVLVGHHGNSRDAAGNRDSARTTADRTCLFVVSPLYDTSRFGGDDYQQGGVLSGSTLRAVAQRNVVRADKFADWGKTWKGLPTSAPHVVWGFSAGAQFASRYAAFSTDGSTKPRAVLTISGAPSTYVWPSITEPVTYGFQHSSWTTTQANTELDAYLTTPYLVVVGTSDNDPNDPDLATSAQAMEQGTDRLDRARNVMTAATTAASSRGVTLAWTKYEVSGAGHSGGPLIRDSRVITAINNAVTGAPPPPALPTVAIGNGTPSPQTEGGQITFPVTLSASSAQTITVAYSTSGGTATSNSDYTAASGTLTFSAGQTSKTITVTTLDDAAVETSNETFTVTLGTAQTSGGTAITKTTSSGTGTIADNDTSTPPTGSQVLSVSDATPDPVSEGGNATFTFKLSRAASAQTWISYSTSDGTATAGSDYTAASGTVIGIAQGQTTATASVAVTSDSTTEPNETFHVSIDAVSSDDSALIAIGEGSGMATISDTGGGGGQPPSGLTVSVSDASPSSISEGGNATFTVTLSAAAPSQVWVSYHTQAGTATSGSDYTAASGAVVGIAQGQTSTTFTVATTNDSSTEGSETFTVVLDAISRDDAGEATIADGTGSATIAASD